MCCFLNSSTKSDFNLFPFPACLLVFFLFSFDWPLPSSSGAGTQIKITRSTLCRPHSLMSTAVASSRTHCKHIMCRRTHKIHIYIPYRRVHIQMSDTVVIVWVSVVCPLFYITITIMKRRRFHWAQHFCTQNEPNEWPGFWAVRWLGGGWVSGVTRGGGVEWAEWRYSINVCRWWLFEVLRDGRRRNDWGLWRINEFRFK